MPKVFQKVCKSRQIIVSRQNSIWGLKIFVQVQTFWRGPVLLHNFCHPGSSIVFLVIVICMPSMLKPVVAPQPQTLEENRKWNQGALPKRQKETVAKTVREKPKLVAGHSKWFLQLLKNLIQFYLTSFLVSAVSWWHSMEVSMVLKHIW